MTAWQRDNIKSESFLQKQLRWVEKYFLLEIIFFQQSFTIASGKRPTMQRSLGAIYLTAYLGPFEDRL